MVKCQLQCGTGEVFVVDIDIIKKSLIIKSMLDDLGIGQDPSVDIDEEVIPLPNLSASVMRKLIDWCTHHKDEPPPLHDDEDGMFNEDISEWDQEFLKMEDHVLFDLILASNYLDIKGLLDVATTHVAKIIVECRTPEAIRARFNIKNDLTVEDLDRIRRDAPHWLDEDDGIDAPTKVPTTYEELNRTAAIRRAAAMKGYGMDFDRPSSSNAQPPQYNFPVQPPSGFGSSRPGPSGMQPGPSRMQPGPSRMQPGPSGMQPGPSGAQPGPSGAQFADRPREEQDYMPEEHAEMEEDEEEDPAAVGDL